MNRLLIVVALILVGYAWKGRHDGFIKTVFALCSVFIALILTTTINPYVSKAIQNNDKCSKYISEKVEKIIDIKEKPEKDSVSDQVKAIDKLYLPKSLKNALVENNNAEVYKALVVDKFEKYVSRYIAAIIINACTFLILFLLITIGLAVLCQVLDIFSKLPLINGLNKTAGLLIGVFRGLVVVWILCILLTVFSGTQWGKTAFIYINDSFLLSSIYNNNILLQLITNMAKVLF